MQFKLIIDGTPVKVKPGIPFSKKSRVTVDFQDDNGPIPVCRTYPPGMENVCQDASDFLYNALFYGITATNDDDEPSSKKARKDDDALMSKLHSLVVATVADLPWLKPVFQTLYCLPDSFEGFHKADGFDTDYLQISLKKDVDDGDYPECFLHGKTSIVVAIQEVADALDSQGVIVMSEV